MALTTDDTIESAPRVIDGPIISADGTGQMFEPDVWGQPMPVLPILAGNTYFFQCWHRDPAAMMSGFNLSDGLSTTWCP